MPKKFYKCSHALLAIYLYIYKKKTYSRKVLQCLNVISPIQGEAGRGGNAGEVGFPGSPVTFPNFIPHGDGAPFTKHFYLKKNLTLSSYLGIKRIPWYTWSTWPEGSPSEFQETLKMSLFVNRLNYILKGNVFDVYMFVIFFIYQQ